MEKTPAEPRLETSSQMEGEPPLPRVPSGDSGLDVVLQGGWLKGGLYVIAGPPGAGKTTLGNQLCFQEVARGGCAVYVTLLAETHGRMVAHLSTLPFFEKAVVGESLHYLSGFSTLDEGGLPGLLRLLNHTVRDKKATVLVVDGVSAAAEKAESKLAYRQFLHGLSVHASLTMCTTLLLTTRSGRAADPEHAMVDGILELAHDTAGMWTVSTLEVTKFRGSMSLKGKHFFTIGSGGLRTYPRIEAVYTGQPDVVPSPDERASFGVPGFDEMLGGGLLGRSSTLLFGSPGSGKTLLGLHFLHAGAARGERGLHFSFSESPARLVAKGRLVGLDIEPAVKKGLLRIESRAAVETLPDALAEELLSLIEEHGATRLFLDGMEPLAQQPLDDRRIQRFVGALLNELRARGVTVVATQQTNALVGPELYPPLRTVEAMIDNIVFLRYFELRSQLYRLLSILKMRESDNDPSLREFSITPQGIDVAATFESAEAILTGQARPVSGKKEKEKTRTKRGLFGRRKGRS